MSFAAFVMTYQRPEILLQTVEALFNQTLPPQKVLIVDNDPARSAHVIFSSLSGFPVAYHAVGYNSGPAGAAGMGLQILSDQGFSWIAWVDDDDPPIFEDSFEILIAIAKENEHCGGVGSVGQYFNRKTGLINRVPDQSLLSTGNIVVDNIAGNMCKIVNGAMVKQHRLYPDSNLFFGFEELDFDLRVQNAGFKLFVPKELYKRNRVYHNRIGFKLKRGQKKKKSHLWREYYSTRNLLVLLIKNNLHGALLRNIIRAVSKSVFGFRYGMGYGLKNAKFILLALIHFFIRKNGRLE